jgi:membrane associated rhomboid family serine protease
VPTRRVPVVVYLLIVANVLSFVWCRALIAAGVDPDLVTHAWGLVPARFLAHPAPEAVTLITSMFVHEPTGLVHIGGNMLFLWIFGDNVEDAMGSLRFAAFYLLCGLVAALAQIAVEPHSPAAMVGASGAISGVLAAYGSLYPRARITVLNPVPLLWLLWGLFFQLPAWIVILEYFVMNLLNGLASVHRPGAGGVAFFAHLGGFVAGLILVRFFMVGRGAEPYHGWEGFRSPPQNARPARRRGPDPWGW